MKTFVDVAGLSHDIRNVMVSIRLATDQLEQAESDSTVKAARKISKAVDACVAFCAAAMESQETTIRLDGIGTIQIGDLVEEVADQLEAQCDERVTINIECPPYIIVPLCQARLYRVLLNLVKNSVDAITMYGGSRIDVTAHVVSSRFVIDVTDDGPGLQATKVESDHRAKYSGPADAGGHGFGLPTATALAREMGGRLFNVGTGSRGTCYRLSLPVEVLSEPVVEPRNPVDLYRQGAVQ